jgi:hypothetical protein
MADFTYWGCAVSQALGRTQEEFLEAYSANIGDQNEEAIHENPVAAAVRALMDRRDEWEGTPSELLENLEAIAEVEKIDMRQKSWPKAANVLSRRINEVKTNLAEISIKIRSEKTSNGKRVILIQKESVDTGQIATASDEPADAQMRIGDIARSSPTSPSVSSFENLASARALSDGGDSGDVNYDSSLPF